MVLKERADSGKFPILRCRIERSFAVSAQKCLRRAKTDNQRDAASKT
jgi:hypothetical protein